MKKVLTAVFLAVVFSVTISASAHADITGLINQTTYNGHTYGITNAGSSWTDAEAFAQTLGGHLVTINNSAENAFLYSQFVAPPGVPTTDYWIGLNCPTGDFLVQANWVWASGEPVTYLNFRSGQPDSTGALGGDRYAVIGFVGTAEWDNYPNSSFRTPSAIVEIAPASVPEPATMLLLGLGLVGLAGVRRFRK